jgi:predicted acyl esterase
MPATLVTRLVVGLTTIAALVAPAAMGTTGEAEPANSAAARSECSYPVAPGAPISVDPSTNETGQIGACVGGDGGVSAGADVQPGRPGTAAVCGEIDVAGSRVVGGPDDDYRTCAEGPAPTEPLARALASIGLDSCSTKNWTPHRAISCVGEFSSFDGAHIDARVTFPADATAPLATVLMLHGWSADRIQWQSGPKPGVAENAHQWSRMRFVARGFAAVAPTARGFYSSCGQVETVQDDDSSGGPRGADLDEVDCTTNHRWTHIGDRRFEIQDWRYLLGLLVDAGFSDPSALAATGSSYGGGQSWELAVEQPWRTPAGAGPIQLAAAVPFYGWTDLFGALAPNGRATDARRQPDRHDAPFGVLKQSWLHLLVGGALAHQPSTAFNGDPASLPNKAYTPLLAARLNHQEPAQLESYIDGWLQRFDRGEPYDDAAAFDLAAAFDSKSAWYAAKDYLVAVRSHRASAVPIFAVQGWTDTLFGATEALQMYRRLKTTVPSYPIWLRLADVGHGARQPEEQQAALFDEAERFLALALRHASLDEVGDPVVSYRTGCAGDGLDGVVRARTLDALADTVVRVDFTADPATTTWLESDASGSLAADPAISAQLQQTPGCVQQPTRRLPYQRVVDHDVTLLGLPRVTAAFSMLGQDATVVARLWDVAPDGQRTLVDRGVYRLTVATDGTAGTLDFRLFGNHWCFLAGHGIALELVQQDPSFFRPDSLPSTLTFSEVTLRLPARR